jgi:hypothetical protein
MRHSDKLAPAGALAAAILSLACCLPLSIPAAIGLAGIGAIAGEYQIWLIGASVALLGMGVFQVVRRPACRRRSRISIGLLCLSSALVVAVLLFPQAIASLIAGSAP